MDANIFNNINFNQIESVKTLDELHVASTHILKSEIDKRWNEIQELYQLKNNLRESYIQRVNELMSQGTTF